MDGLLRKLMNITDEQAAGDADKIKAMRTCVGWFSSPACALIYQARRRLARLPAQRWAPELPYSSRTAAIQPRIQPRHGPCRGRGARIGEGCLPLSTQ